MKRQDLEKVVDKFCKHIHQYSQKIPGYFENEDIHELRVDYKKLRSFVRMLHPDVLKTEELGISANIQNLYQKAGAVRDLLLFQDYLNSAELPIVPEKYFSQLQHRLFKKKEDYVIAAEAAGIEKTKKKISHALPKQLTDEMVKKFLHRKIAAIKIILLAIQHDEDLHSIRKHLKDISNNVKVYANEWGLSFPVIAWKSENLLHDTGTAFGDYNDRCITLAFLSQPDIQDLPTEERDTLNELQKKVVAHKEMSKQKLLEQFHQLNLTSDF